MVRLPALITRAAVTVAVALPGAAGWWSSSTAVAADAPWVTAPGGMPLFDLAAVAPGDHGSATLVVTNPGDAPVTFTMTVVDLANDDNGCNDPEVKAGDVTCGPGGGELQLDLRLSLWTAGSPGAVVADATVSAWAGTTVADSTPLAAHATRSYDVGWVLPIGSSNVTQTDRVSFAFRFALDEVGADSASEGPVVIPATPALPATGVDARGVAMVALLALLVGLVVHRRVIAHR